MTTAPTISCKKSTLPRLLGRLSVLSCSVSGLALSAVPAAAQVAAPTPVRQSIDGNGVDLFYGTMNVDGPTLSAGQSETQGLAWKKVLRGGNGWGDNLIASLTIQGSTVLISFGGSTDRFSKSGSVYTATEGNGANLSLSGNVYTYIMSDGTVVHFDKTKVAGGAYAFTGLVTDVVRPNGATLTYTYTNVAYCSRVDLGESGDTCVQHSYAYRVASVQSSSGYQLTLSYDSSDAPADPDIPPDDLFWESWNKVAGTSITNTVVTGASTRSQTYATSYPGGDYENFTITDPLSNSTTYRRSTSLTAPGLAGIKRPGKTAEDITIGYNGSNKVASVTTPVGTTTYAYSDSGDTRTTTVTDPGGHATIYTFQISTQLMLTATDPLSHTTTWTYDSSGRVLTVTVPETNKVIYTYDARGNVTETRIMPKGSTGPSIADIVTTAGYDTTCGNAVTCNRPNWTKDAKTNQTDYTYDSGTGNVLTVTAPAPVTSGTRPKATYTYTTAGGVSLVSSVSACQTTASCSGTADETKTTIGYNGNLLPNSVTRGAGDGSLTATTTIGYDDVGNRTTIDGPLSGTDDTTTMRYDANRQLVGVISADPDGSGSLKRRAVRTTYNERGVATVVEGGTVTGTTDTDWTGFTSLQQVTTTLDDADRKWKVVATAGSTTIAVAQYSYDSDGRLDCTVLRMKPGSWSSLPPSACTATTGSGDDDRISQIKYDIANRVTKLTSALGTSVASDDVIKGYSVNGLLTSLTDAEGNKTTYVYDSLDRLSQTQFPNPTKGDGGSSSTDDEELTYDPNGNVTSRRLRDGTSIGYGYDNLNRLVSKDLPGSGELDVSYTYDLLGRPLTAATSAQTLTFSYDALGRNLTQGGPLGTVSYQYDPAGRRTRMTWPDTFYVTYDYDVLGELSAVKESGSTTLTGFTYDDLGRRIGLSHGNGVTTTYGYDTASQLTSLVQNLNGTSQDLTLGFDYNKAGQIVSTTRSNDSYSWTGSVNLTRGYTSNGLNQYSVAGPATLTYDDHRGNVTSSTQGSITDSFTYSSENLLLTGPNSATLSYDALMRLSQVGSATNGTSQMLYDGQTLIGQSNATGTPIRRYVLVPGTDEILVEYKLSNNSKTWKITDNLGSVLNATDASGNGVGILTYDEYGIPATGNSMRYQYTGQIFLPEIGMHYYKARMYSPSLGRFMQPDPIGYGDGLNWHNYVSGDPVNETDPSGLTSAGCPQVGGDITICSGGRLHPGDVRVINPNQLGEQPTDYATGDIIITSINFGKNPSRATPPGLGQAMSAACAQVVRQGGPVIAWDVTGSFIAVTGGQFGLGYFYNETSGSSGFFRTIAGGFGLDMGVTGGKARYDSINNLFGTSGFASGSVYVGPKGSFTTDFKNRTSKGWSIGPGWGASAGLGATSLFWCTVR